MSWVACTLDDICDKVDGHIQTGPFGSQLHQSDYSKVGTPVVMPKDIVNGTISEEGIARVSEEHVLRLSRHKVRTGDILFSRRGDVGRCAYISPKEQGWLCGTGCLRVTVDAKVADSKFIFYYLQQASAIDWIEKHAIGATMLNLNTGILATVPIMLPSLPTQRRIASILSAYDDLIENNRRQIKLLEEAAQRLYREWFVELRFPGHEGVKVVDGVPEGWTVTTASEVTNVLRRGISPNYDETARLSVISQKCIRQYMVDMNQVRRQSKSFDSSMGLLDSDTVICSTGTGTLGRVGKVFGNHPNCTFDSHVTLVRTNGTVGKHYLNLRMYELREYFDSCKTGSTNQTELSRSIVQNVKVYIADSHTQKIFEKIEEAYHQKMMICQHQIQLLTETRDRLLPKLMNGEMEV